MNFAVMECPGIVWGLNRNAAIFRSYAAEKAAGAQVTRKAPASIVSRGPAGGFTRLAPRAPLELASGQYIMVNKPDFSPDAIVHEMQRAMRTLAAPGNPGESVKTAINRAARRAGLTHLQARRLWYGTWIEIPAYVVDGIRVVVEQSTAQEIEQLQARLNELRRLPATPAA